MVSKILSRKILLLIPVLSAFLLTSGLTVFATVDSPESILSITRIEVRTATGGEEILIRADRSFEHSTFVLSDPDRLMIDIPHAVIAIDDPELGNALNFVKSITTRSVSQGGNELVRVEMQLFQATQYTIDSIENGIAVRFGELAIGSARESADAKTMTQTLPTGAQTVSGSKEAEQEGISEPAYGSAAQQVYGITPATKYKGKPIFLDLKDADILDIFRLIAEVSGFNVVVDPNVGGRITIRMDNVPWDQALEVILKNQGLGKEIEGNVMRIARNTTIRDENRVKQQLEHAKRLALPMETTLLYLSYADIADMKDAVDQLLSERGRIEIDKRVNALILTDIRSHINTITNLVSILDVRTRQVTLNSQIIATQKSFARDLGIQWGGRFLADAAHGNTTGYRFPNNFGIDFGQNPTGGSHPGWDGDGSGYTVNLPSGDNLLSLSFGNITDTLKLNVALSAAESEGLLKTIAQPRVSTSNNEKANITSGVEIPYQVNEGDEGINIQFKNAATTLDVTPHITNDDWISMNVNITRNSPGFEIGGLISINTNTAQSKVLVKDGGTMVIGGLNETTITNSTERIPFLHKIPVLGWLFKNNSKQRSYNDLLFFITPHILEEGEQGIRSESL